MRIAYVYDAVYYILGGSNAGMGFSQRRETRHEVIHGMQWYTEGPDIERKG